MVAEEVLGLQTIAKGSGARDDLSCVRALDRFKDLTGVEREDRDRRR